MTHSAFIILLGVCHTTIITWALVIFLHLPSVALRHRASSVYIRQIIMLQLLLTYIRTIDPLCKHNLEHNR